MFANLDFNKSYSNQSAAARSMITEEVFNKVAQMLGYRIKKEEKE